MTRPPSAGAPRFDPGAEAARATAAILHDMLHGADRGVVVDSPPGAGKSTLVVRAALELAAAGRPLMVIAQTNAQVDDLVLRLAEKEPDLPVGRLHSNDTDPYDKALDDLANVRKSAKAADLAGLDVVISTAAKWAHVKTVDPWSHAIVDEAYQMRSDALLAVAGLFERALFVGDPGQLDPFSIVGADQWAGLSYDPSASAVSTLLAHNPELPQHRLPVSWRLPASAAPLVSVRASTRTRPSAAVRATATGASPSASRPTARAPTGCWTRRPPRAGACWNSRPGTPRARTPRPWGRWPRSYAASWTGAARRQRAAPPTRPR